MEQRRVQRIDTVQFMMRGDHKVGQVLDPYEMEKTDPFLFLAHDDFPKGTFGLHPHRGIETVTYVLAGEVQHFDNKNGGGTIKKGDVQWMTAGGGVLHSEEPVGDRAQVLQLWVNLPRKNKMVAARYQNLLRDEMPVVKNDTHTIRVFSGSYEGVTAPTQNYVPVTMLDIQLQAGAKLETLVSGTDTAFLYIISGSGRFGQTSSASANQVVHLEKNLNSESLLTIEATEDLHVLFYGGPALNEPIVARGPFVMNTAEEIHQAFTDYRLGKFE